MPAPTPEQITARALKELDGRLTFPFQPHQQIPSGQWSVCMFQAGRGSGKTWTGAAWAAMQAETVQPNMDGVLVAPTFRGVREVMVEHRRSGILAMLGDRAISYNRSTHEITTRSGSKIYMRSAEEPDSLNGLSVAWSWCDELALWRYPATWHDGLSFAMREAEHPKRFVTTTPRPVQLIRELTERHNSGDGAVEIMRASTMDNKHLPAAAVAEMRKQYEGKRLGRQEIYGELIEDVEGALWRSEWIVVAECPPLDEFVSVAVGVDPSGGRDEIGIVAAGKHRSGRLWVLADRSGNYSPREWAHTVVGLADEFDAERIVVERNFGGDMARDTIERHADRDVSHLVEMVTASRGKRQRAEPVAVLYEPAEGGEAGLEVCHADVFGELTDQMLSWVPGVGSSPDRVDALVWVLSWLSSGSGAGWAEMHDLWGGGSVSW